MRANEGFVFLKPATTGPGVADSNGVFLSKVAGGQNYGNEVLIDGISQERSENGSSYDEEAPSVEALAEFKVTTSLPQAEFGRTTGGVESFVTKSGTNQYHGGAYDIYRDRRWMPTVGSIMAEKRTTAPGRATLRNAAHSGVFPQTTRTITA